MTDPDLNEIDRRIVACERCARLRRYCGRVAAEKRAAYRDQAYWGKPVPNLVGQTAKGFRSPRLLIVGLAPAAHGANRTGRMFTGDKSGDFLYHALHAVGLANQPQATGREDGLILYDTVITAAIHCAPPQNKPKSDELANCSEYLQQTVDALVDLRIILALGKMAHDAVLRLYKRRTWIRALADHRFEHGRLHRFPEMPATPLGDCYHPSQQNTFTGKLTQRMLQNMLRKAKSHCTDR